MANIELQEVVKQFLDGNDYGHAEYRKAYNIAIRGWRILRWDVDGQIKTTELNVKCDLTADLPHDFLGYSEIGVSNSNGTLALLTENPHLSEIIDCDVDYENNSYYHLDTDPSVQYYDNYNRGKGSVNNIGEFKIDLTNNKVIFSPDFCYSRVILKYNSNNFEGKGEYYINEMCSEALLAFITYEWYKHKQGVPQNHKAEYLNTWYNQKRLAKARMRNYSLQQLNDASRLNVKAVIKS